MQPLLACSLFATTLQAEEALRLHGSFVGSKGRCWGCFLRPIKADCCSTAVHHHHAPVMVSFSAKANCLSVPRTTLRCEIVPSLLLDRTLWRGATADLLQYRERERPTWESCMPRRRERREREGGRPRSKCQKGNNPCELEDRQPCRSFFC